MKLQTQIGRVDVTSTNKLIYVGDYGRSLSNCRVCIKTIYELHTWN